MSPLRALAAVGFWVVVASQAVARPGEGNRLTYLDGNDPYYVSRTFPKLITPQWVGEEGVEAVVILAIDDMREPAKYEQVLRPILNRLKQIDGRAPVSIMTNQVRPDDPQLAAWLREGLSLETHTADHPCPLLAGGDFKKAKDNYDRCVELMGQVPGNGPVAFRMPCCDSLNTPSPRFFSEIFNKATPSGKFLTIDSSVFNITTPNDPALPRDIVLDPDGRERFRKYVPFDSFVNTIEDYPYPYVINKLCWEFPCATPSDWQAQNLHKPNNPKTVEDWKALLDATVIKQGVMTMVFHPHGWIKPEQMVELIDHAVTKHGKKVMFLNFKEAQERLDKNLLHGTPLRDRQGNDNKVRLLDVNNDGYIDVLNGGDAVASYVWLPAKRQWFQSDFVELEGGSRFGVFQASGEASVVLCTDDVVDALSFSTRWDRDDEVTEAIRALADKHTARHAAVSGLRLRDIDRDGCCELILGGQTRSIAGRNSARGAFARLPFEMPEHCTVATEDGSDNGVRFIDLNEDGFDDIIWSNDESYGVYLFNSMKDGWSRNVIAGKAGDADAIPQIVRNGTDNGAWFHSRHLWVQNEDTAKLPNLVDRRSFADLAGSHSPTDTVAKSPEGGVRSMQVKPGFKVELMASEPLLTDPVNFDWGPDGKFWVVEMTDYPLGIDGKGKPGGRVLLLGDPDDAGKYRKATTFLDGLPYPDGIMAWRKGVLIAAAPDIIYAEDTDGDGKADKKEVLFTGFTRGNPQHNVNGFVRGLDNWIYGANGHSGGSITVTKTGKVIELGARDFRFRPDDGSFEPLAGLTQFGRTRDDWGNWFGCDNSNPIIHFVLDDQYLRRNPHVAPPQPWRELSEAQLPIFPASQTVERFNDFGHVNRITSSNSVHLYRDDLFGPAFANTWFVSEPVHNLIHRQVLAPDGVTFTSARAAGEEKSEFLASTDNWSRPTTIRTGPDGALWFADMYRQVIEHPEWIPVEWQRKFDLRAGADKGRIYRVVPVGAKPRPIPRLGELDTPALVAALDSPNGWQRDVAQELLVQRNDAAAAPLLEEMIRRGKRPQARLQALCALDGMKELNDAIVLKAMADEHSGVRRHAVRLCEGRMALGVEFAKAAETLVDDPDAHVRLQLAYTLGDCPGALGGLLGRLALKDAGDPYLSAAVLSSVSDQNLGPMLRTVMSTGGKAPPPPQLLEKLLDIAVATNNADATATLLALVTKAEGGRYEPWQFSALATLQDSLGRRDRSLDDLARSDGAARLGPAVKQTSGLIDAARELASDAGAPVEQRATALRLLARDAAGREQDLKLLAGLLSPQVPEALQDAAVSALGRVKGEGSDRVPPVLLAGWKGYGPALRAAALDALLGRPPGVKALLDAIEAKKVLPAEIEAERRQRLLQHADPQTRERAGKLLADVVNPDRQKLLEALAPAASLGGEPSRGKATFTKVCSTCHKLNGEGNAVGPDLAALSDKSPDYLLMNVVDPNRAVEAKFTNYVVETRAGETLSGILAGETGNSVTLLGADGKSHVVLRGDVKTLRSTGLSLMPEGLETGLTPQDLADLIAYVRSSGAAQDRKTVAGNKPEVVRPGAGGTLRLLPANAEIYGKTLTIEEHGSLGYWNSQDDKVVWVIEPAQPGKYAVWVEWACDDSVANNRFYLTTPEFRDIYSVQGTGNWDTYKKAKIEEVSLRPGRQRITITTEGPVAGALMDLKSVELIPVSK